MLMGPGGHPIDVLGVRGASLSYPIVTPKGTEKLPPPGRHWSTTEDGWKAIVVFWARCSREE